MGAEERLVDLAASVADGAPVDWTTAESDAGAREQRILRHLRLVSDVAEMYRSLSDSSGAPGIEPPQPAGPKWGRLVLVDRVGEGTSSEVYRAWDPELQREVALKLLKVDGSGAEAARWRLLGEARRLARVRHPHVVTVYGADRRDDRVGLWMELVEGATLHDLVRRNGPLGAREAALVGLDLCGALAAVHSAGLVHRDVKAQNVMRETGGRIVLMDFGTGEEMKVSGGPRLAGTPLYFAPEIFARKRASAASDLYSLGVLLFYLVTGQFPIAASTFEELARAHQRRESRRLRDLRADLPEAFVRVVECALSHDPHLRYESAGGMEAALRQALDGTPAEAAPTTVPRARPIWRWVAAAAVAAVAIAAVFSLAGRQPTVPASSTTTIPLTQMAVLPLADLSAGGAPPYLADALTDQLIATLGQVRALRVTSRTSVLRFKDGTTPIRDIARTLGVGSVLEGSVNVGRPDASGATSVTVNARLIAAGTDTQLWAETFQRQLGDALALQGDIARAVAQAIDVALTAGEADRLEQGQTTSQAAAEAYFQGRYYLNQIGSDNSRRALSAFDRAVQLDPDYAGAHAGRARAFVSLGFTGAITPAEARTSALAATTRALALDPRLAEGHAGLGDLRFYHDWDWKGAEAAYRHAIELNPSFSRARMQYAQMLAASKRAKEAVDETRRAEELDPLSAGVSQIVALMLYYARDYDGALNQFRKAQTLDDRSAGIYIGFSRVHEVRREWTPAMAAIEKAISLTGGLVPSQQAHLARLHALSGNPGAARRRMSALIKSAEAARIRLGGAHHAYVAAALGETDRALSLLERAVAERDPDVLWIAVDPRVDSLRSSPRFQELIRKIGLTP